MYHSVSILHVELEQPAAGGVHQGHEVGGDTDPGQTKGSRPHLYNNYLSIVANIFVKLREREGQRVDL